ncbi:uncharacterized protein V3H82_002477 isoform 10-T10 [Fundulus diaphanus]
MTSPSLNATSPQVTVSSTTINITSALPMSTSLSGNATLQQTSTTSPQVNETSQSTPSPISQTSATSNVTSQSTLSSTISTTTTAATTTTTTPAPPPEPKIRLQFNLMATFTEDLKNNSSPQFKELERNVTTALDGLYRKSFGDRFNRTVIKGFRQGSVVAETELIFNNVSALPNTSDVTETLKNASSDPAFNLPVNTTTIAAEVVLAPTQPPTTTTVTTTVKTTSVTGTGNETTANLEVTTTSRTTLNSTSVPGTGNETTANLEVTTTSGTTLNSTSVPGTVNGTTTNLAVTTTAGTTVNTTSVAVNGTSTQPASPTTVTTATTTTAAVPADSRLNLEFRLTQPFDVALENSSSLEFRQLAQPLTEQLNAIYRGRFRGFLRALIRAFRRGSVIVDSELQFANASSVPETQAVADTLLEARNSSNFTLPLNTSSVVVMPIEATTVPPTSGTVNGTTTNLAVATTAGTTVNTTSVAANTTSQPLSPTSPAANMTSPPLNATSVPVSPTSPTANMTSPSLNATSPSVSPTSPAANMTSPPLNATSVPVSPTSPTANMTSPSLNATSPSVSPTSTAINMTSPSLNATSVTVSSTTINITSALPMSTSPSVNGTSTQPASPTTVTTATTTTAAVPADSRLNLEFRLTQPFADGLDDSSSPVFRQLAQSLTEQLNAIYRRRFRGFLRALIRAFRRGSVIVDSELQFANASSVPETQAVADTLLEARNSSNFTLPLNTSSVVVTPIEATTVPPTTGVEATTVPPTTALSTTTAFTDPPAASEGSLSIRFSLNRVFTAALTDTTSSEFIQLASTVITEMNRICSRLFLRFSRSRVNSFTSGSVVVNTTVVFRDASSVPSLAAAQSQLAAALLTSNLDYINGTLVVGK